VKSLLCHLIPFRFWPYNYLKRIVDAAVNDGVIGGPFKGLQYGRQAVCSALYPKLLGTYEKELHDSISQLAQVNLRTLIDIGAAEGYYACGFARLFPQLKVIAYEADLPGRYLLRQNLALNGLDNRVAIRGFCDAAEMGRVLAEVEQPALIICDTEGHEYELLVPDQVPALRHCYLLVEMHEFMLPGITDCIQQRFAATHRIANIAARPRTTGDFPNIPLDSHARLLPDRHRLSFLDEHRPAGMNWLWMKPLTTDH
jgi:predicted O-methyltransferase YrrM